MRGIILGAALLSVAAIGSAAADVKVLATSGYWQAFGGIARDGIPVCGIMADGGGRSFTLKYFKGAGHLTIQMFKQTWDIPEGIKIDVILQFDGETPWRANATGFARSGPAGAGIEFDIMAADVETFEREMRYSAGMKLWFPGGNEQPWTGNLTGSNGAVTAMVSCMYVIRGGGGAAPTQPYSVTPSQPYAPPAPATVRNRL